MQIIEHITGEYTVDHGKIVSVEARSTLQLPKEQQEISLTVLQHMPANTALRELNLALTRQQIKASVTSDQLIINTINTIEELDKVCNSLAKRLREWYALYDPETEHAYQDHHPFVEAVLARTNQRKEDTMGATLAEEDLQTIATQATALNALYLQREVLVTYLETLMQEQAPNTRKVAGAMIGAKLMSMAGSMQRLSKMPASTIQLLGAETALFRHLRNKKARPPKHGVIFNHPLLQRAPRQLRGKIARTIADKISIATKVDYFKGEYIGDELYKKIEEVLK